MASAVTTLLPGLLESRETWRYVVNLAGPPANRSTPVERVPSHSAPEASSYSAPQLITLLLKLEESLGSWRYRVNVPWSRSIRFRPLLLATQKRPNRSSYVIVTLSSLRLAAFLGSCR